MMTNVLTTWTETGGQGQAAGEGRRKLEEVGYIRKVMKQKNVHVVRTCKVIVPFGSRCLNREAGKGRPFKRRITIGVWHGLATDPLKFHPAHHAISFYAL
jgi:hypothetical protein